MPPPLRAVLWAISFLKIRGNDKGLRFQFPIPGILSFEGYLLTAVGREIMTLGSFANDTHYLVAIGRLVMDTLAGTSAWVGDCVRDPSSHTEILVNEVEILRSAAS